MFLKSQVIKCGNCIKPTERRLGLFRAMDDYECYGEGYVKCFWSLCDRIHVSQESLITKTDVGIITVQPNRQGLLHTNTTT